MRVRFEDVHEFVVPALLVIFMALAFLFVMEIVTDHEVPEFPDCQEDEVLDYVTYDSDPDARTYKCVHVEDVNP